MNFSLACDHVTELVSESQDRPLTYRQRLSLWLHLWTCQACRLFQKQVRLLRKSVKAYNRNQMSADFAQTPGLSDDARDRIKQKLCNRQKEN